LRPHFKYGVIRFTGYGVIAEKPRASRLGRFYSVHPVGKTALDRKMIYTFFDCLDELYHHAKFGEIVQRAPAIGAKMWCLPRGKLPVLFLLTGQKSGFSPRRGDSLHRLTSNFAGPTGTWVRLAVQNFTSIATGGGNAAPIYQKFPLFGKESPRRGDSLDQFRKF